MKYPRACRKSQLLGITKSDLLPYFDCDIEECGKDAKALNPGINILEVSAKTGEGMDGWIDFLDSIRK